MPRRLYNIATYFWHRILRVPIRLKKVQDIGSRHAKLTVVFLHGISATSATWNSTFKQLSRELDTSDVRLVAFDLLGFGKSLQADWFDYDELDYCQALDCALRKLKIHGDYILVGHSMGSLIAADYVVDYVPSTMPNRLILVSPPVLMADELAKLPDKVYTKSYAALHQFAKDVPAADVIARFVQRISSFRDYIKTTAFKKAMDNIILNPKNYQIFTKIHIPTTIIHGHFDPLVLGSNLKRAVKRNPHHLSYVSVIGHHDISIGKRAKILTIIKTTLKEIDRHETI